jgi:hypothetical protein
MFKTLESECGDFELQVKTFGLLHCSQQYRLRCLEFCIWVIRICLSTGLKVVSRPNHFVLRISNFGFTVMRDSPRPFKGAS